MFSRAAAETQTAAWMEELEVISAALRIVSIARPEALQWGIVFEYELPLEGGRRPDIVLLAGQTIGVLEFKSSHRINRGSVDQVAAYARDLAEYHEASHGVPIQPILVLTRGTYSQPNDQGVVITDVGLLGSTLDKLASEGQLDLTAWLNSDYKPLPFSVDAAPLNIKNEPLPHVRRALSAGIPEAVELLCNLAADAANKGDRVLAMLWRVTH